MKKIFKKKLILSTVSILITSGLVLALWLIGTGVTGFATYRVSSDHPSVSINTQLLGADLDATNSSQSFTDHLKVLSTTSDNASVYFEFIKADTNLSDSCIDFMNDSEIYLYYDDGFGYGFETPLDSGDIIKLKNGINDFKINGTFKKGSCPANITAIVNLTLLDYE